MLILSEFVFGQSIIVLSTTEGEYLWVVNNRILMRSDDLGSELNFMYGYGQDKCQRQLSYGSISP